MSSLYSGIESNLRALSKIMKQREKNEDIDAVLQSRQITAFCLVMSTYPDDTHIGGAASSALGATAGANLKNSTEFGDLFKKLVHDIQSPDVLIQAGAAHSLAEILRGGDPDVLELLLSTDGVFALFQALDARGENAAVRKDILNALTEFSRELTMYSSRLSRQLGG